MDPSSARRLIPAAASLAGHAVLIALLLARLVSHDRAAPGAPSPALIAIAVEVPPDPSVLARSAGAAGPVLGQPVVAARGAGDAARLPHAGMRISAAPHAPSQPDPYADLTVSIDADGTGDSGGDGQPGLGGGGAGGLGGAGLGPLGAAPATPPLPALAARPPRPKYDYSDVMIRGSRAYRGMSVRLELSIDAHGVVRGVRILESIERHVDFKAIRFALQFEFEPATDTAGHPTAGRLPWRFIVQG